MTVSTTGNRAEYSLNATTASFAFASGGVNFTVFDEDDLKVYVNGVLKEKSTHYTVSINSSNEGTVTFVSSPTDHRPTSGQTVVIVREVPLTQNTNYQNNNIFDAETLEKSLDYETMKSQQTSVKTDRAIKFSDTATGITSNVTEITAPAISRANKLISFDADGDIQVTQEIGTYLGNWTTATVYVQRDLVKQSSSNDGTTKDNVYICTVAHTSTGTHLTQNDTANWALILDVATASGGVSESADWARKTDGIVSASSGGNDYSSKAYAIGGTGVTDTAGKGSAKDWATKAEDSTVDTSEYSAKHYSAKASASSSSASGSATTATNAKNDAEKLATNAHNSQYTLTDSSTGYSALHYATEASNSATTSASNKERFLTANSSDPTTRDPNGSGSALQEGDMYFNTSQNKMKVRNASNAWQDTSSSIAGVASVTEYNGSQATNNKWFALTHDVGLQIVWLNGVRQVQGSDYYSVNSNSSTTNITSGTASHIYFISNVASTDVISIMAFGQVNSTAVVAKSGGTFTGGVTFEAGTTHNTGSNTFTMPTTRGDNNYVLTRDNSVGTGGTAWKETVTAPSISSVTTPASDNSINEDTNVTMTINGSNFNNTMSVSLVDATSGATVTGHGNLGIASFVSSAQITVNTVAATSNISNSNVKVKVDKSGLSATSSSISVSPDPTFSAPSSNGTTLATILDLTGGNVEVVGSSGIVASASDSASITYALDQTSTNANNTWQFNTTTGVVTSPTAGVYDVPSGNSYQEPFTVTATAGGDSSRTDSRTFNIIVNKSPSSTNSGGVGSITTYTGYRVHSWTATGSHSNSFTLYASQVCDVLMVGAGGGGGGSGEAHTAGGGAGGGGVYEMTQVTLPSGTYSITVGAGGTGGYGWANNSVTSGGDSSITFPDSTIYTAKGGAHGGAYGGASSPDTGGSGGGGGNSDGTYSDLNGGQAVYDLDSSDSLPTGHATYGSDGGDAQSYGSASSNAGGGGGAGQAGFDSSSQSVGGNGGAGRLNSWRTGSNVMYGSGGGGGGSTTSGAGGNGQTNHGAGDGKQGYSGNGASGSANQGGGAGGGCSGGGGSGSHYGGTGGSGIVVIRYAV